MSEFKIEKGIPIPPKPNYTKYPWRDMDVGDSFYVAGKTIHTIRGSMVNANKRINREFVARQEGDGVRVWRTK